MAHIHTEPGQHDHTVTAYIIRTDTVEPKALLHLHKKLGVLLPVGGHIELNETLWVAVAHEVSEESGYKLQDLVILQPPEVLRDLEGVAIHPYPLVLNTHVISDDHYHSDIAFGFVTTIGPNGIIADGESQDLRWYTHEELLQLPSNELYTNTRQVYDFMFTTALPNWEQRNATDFAV